MKTFILNQAVCLCILNHSYISQSYHLPLNYSTLHFLIPTALGSFVRRFLIFAATLTVHGTKKVPNFASLVGNHTVKDN